MDLNFILFFIFVLIIILILEHTQDGAMLLVYGLFFLAIFSNTQSESPIFFANEAYLGWGQLFNMFWIVLVIVSIVKSMFIAKDRGLFGVKS